MLDDTKQIQGEIITPRRYRCNSNCKPCVFFRLKQAATGQTKSAANCTKAQKHKFRNNLEKLLALPIDEC